MRYRFCSGGIRSSCDISTLTQTSYGINLLENSLLQFIETELMSYRFYSVLRTVQSKRVRYRFCSGGTRSSCDISTLTQTSYGINLLENSSLQFVETELMSYRFYSVLRTVQIKRVRYRFCSGGTRSSCDISTLTQTSYGINLLENSSLQFVETELMSYRFYSVLRTVQSKRVRYRFCSGGTRSSCDISTLTQTSYGINLLENSSLQFVETELMSYRFYSVLRTVQSKRMRYRFCSGGTRSSCDISTLTQTSYGINLLENSSLQFVEIELMSYRFYSVLRTVQSKRVRYRLRKRRNTIQYNFTVSV